MTEFALLKDGQVAVTTVGHINCLTLRGRMTLDIEPPSGFLYQR